MPVLSDPLDEIERTFDHHVRNLANSRSISI